MRNALLTTFVLALLVAPLAIAEETYTYRYAWGGAGVVSAAGACYRGFFDEGDDGPIAVGGPCDLAVLPGQTVTATAVDDVKGSNVQLRVFFFNIETSEDVECAPFAYGTGTLSVVVPEGCSYVSVRVVVGATTGTLTISVA